jgi:hypothetical protein
MLFKVQKGSLTALNLFQCIVSAAFFVLTFFLVYTYFLTAQGELVGDTSSLQRAYAAEPREYKLSYDIGFWIFKRVGVGIATLEKTDKPSTYMLTLEARSVGILALVVKRQVIYQTVMEFDKKSNRLRPLSSSQKRIKEEKIREKIIKFDYENGVCIFEYRKNGVLKKEKTIPIPSGFIPEDPVTAFHNLCNGVYGEIKEGSIYDISIVVKEIPSSLTFEVCSAKYKKEFALEEDMENDFGFVAKINVAPEIVDSTKGEIFVCFSNDSIPLGVKVKDVIGFGDMYGCLVNKVTRPRGEEVKR